MLAQYRALHKFTGPFIFVSRHETCVLRHVSGVGSGFEQRGDGGVAEWAFLWGCVLSRSTVLLRPSVSVLFLILRGLPADLVDTGYPRWKLVQT